MAELLFERWTTIAGRPVAEFVCPDKWEDEIRRPMRFDKPSLETRIRNGYREGFDVIEEERALAACPEPTPDAR